MPGHPQQGSGPYGASEPVGEAHGASGYSPGTFGSGQYGGDQYRLGQYAGHQYGIGGFGDGTRGPDQPGAGTYRVGSRRFDYRGADEAGAGQYQGNVPGGGQPGYGPGGVTVLAPVPPGGAPQPPAPPGPFDFSARDEAARLDQAEPGQAGVWPEICDQFGLHLLVLAERLLASLDDLEADEGDPERLRRLYQVDHAVTRMRRATRDLRTLAGRSDEELAGFTTSLLDVIRMATSAIERYTQVSIGRVADLAVLGYVADDIGSALAVLLDNATRYSPGTVTVSVHLLEDGGVMFRVEDTGIGMSADQVAELNATLSGPVPDVDERTGRHTGFPVIHRIARKHEVGIRFATRPVPGSGMVAMVTLPPHLLCEVPMEEPQRRPGSVAGSITVPTPAPRPSVVTDLPHGSSHGEPTRPHLQQKWEPPQPPPARDESLPVSDLPRRERASLRGDELRPKSAEPVAVRTPEQQAAARRAFAEELSAFALGAVIGQDSDGDVAVEEEAQQ